jgi:tripartite-type tricarboxylate transporter receptor subunit TctC
MLSRRHFVAAAAGLAAHPLPLAGPVRAQTISKPARMLVGLAPGGGVDAVARLLVEHIKGYSPSLIVENRAGAGGRIALEALKAAEPDGSVMGLVPADQLSLFPYIYAGSATGRARISPRSRWSARSSSCSLSDRASPPR